MQSQRKYVYATVAIALVSAAVVAGGFRVLLNYESKPGAVANVPKSWPGSQVPLATDRMTLVMLAHPHCPCTEASMSELAEIMAHVQGQAVAYVLFARPTDAGADWDDTTLRRTAATIPGVTVVSDTDGVEARRFGAETSGHTLLFAPSGELLFSGGITASRGHAGDNVGQSAIVSLVHHEPNVQRETFVFGCALPNAGKSVDPTLASR